MYRGKSAIIATMHGKDAVIAPAMADVLGLTCRLAGGIDTDRFGTFSGEIARRGTMLNAALAKAKVAMAAEGVTVAIASEGSFGPYPEFPLANFGLELMVFVDQDRSLVISESLSTFSINFGQTVVCPGEGLDAFLTSVRFPSHGVMVRPNLPTRQLTVAKDFEEMAGVAAAVDEMSRLSEDGKACVFTDMRAHRNPTRMTSISELARKLAQRIAVQCPRCGAPGFGLTDSKPGLPCSQCGSATASVDKEIFRCVACSYSAEYPRRDGKTHEEPTYCAHCNP